MILTICLLGLFGGLAQGQDEAFDYRDLKFYFHDQTNLLLAMDDEHCYFIDARTSAAESDIRNHQRDVEVEVYYAIHHDQGVEQSSLSEVRNTYNDLLADFRCENKEIFNLKINWSRVGRDGDADEEENEGRDFDVERIRNYLESLPRFWEAIGRK